MSAKDAVYRLVHKFPGGVAAMAARMQVNPHSLQNKVNPNEPGAHVYIEDAEAMTAISGDPQVAQALATSCGHICLPVKPMQDIANKDLAAKIALAGKEFGDVMAATLAAIGDGRVTMRELAEFDRQFLEQISAGVAVREELARMVPQAPSLKVAK